MFPCTIFMDRYGGCYSGGKWIAVPVDAECVIGYLGGDPNAGDNDAMDIVWTDKRVGRGNTPDEALKDLESQ